MGGGGGGGGGGGWLEKCELIHYCFQINLVIALHGFTYKLDVKIIYIL